MIRLTANACRLFLRRGCDAKSVMHARVALVASSNSGRSFSKVTFRKPRPQQSESGTLPPPADTAASDDGAANAINDPRFYEKFTFTKDFLSSSAQLADVHSVQEGTFLPVDMEQFDRYLPEGCSGPMEEALGLGGDTKKQAAFRDDEESENKVWMVRESTKLVCKLIDEHDARITGKKQDRKASSVRTRRSFHVPGLTDREEWPANTLKVTQYGRDLCNFSKETLQGKRNYVRLTKREESAVDTVMDKLKAAPADSALPDKILLTGERGVGKSFVMTQAVLYARQKGWLVVHIPRGWDQVCEGSFIEPPAVPLPEQRVSDGDRDILTSMEVIANPSVRNPNHPSHAEAQGLSPLVFDNTFQSAAALRGLYRAHAEELRSIPITYSNTNNNTTHYRSLFNRLNGDEGVGAGVKDGATYSSVDALQLLRTQFLSSAEKILSTPGRGGLNFMQLRELVEGEDSFPEVDSLDADLLRNFNMNTFEFKTLADLALFGLAIRPAAGSCFTHIIEELRRLKDGRKMMFAVDQYNTFDAPSAYRWNKQTVYGRDLCVPRALYGLSKKRAHTDAYKIGNGSGIMLCATSHTHEEGRTDTYFDALKSVPLVVRVPGYNQVEFLAAMRYQAHMQRLTEFVTVAQLLTYRMLCASNPAQVRANSFLYFTALGLNQFLDAERFEYLSSTTEGAVALRAAQMNAVDNLDNSADDSEEDAAGGDNGEEGASATTTDGGAATTTGDASPHTTAATNNALRFGITEQQRKAQISDLESRFAQFKRNFKGIN